MYKEREGPGCKIPTATFCCLIGYFLRFANSKEHQQCTGFQTCFVGIYIGKYSMYPANASRTRSLWFIKRDPLFNEPRHEVGVHQQQLKDHQKNSMQILPASQKSVEMTLCLEVPFRHRKCRHGNF